jgi:hypothetical protein
MLMPEVRAVVSLEPRDGPNTTPPLPSGCVSTPWLKPSLLSSWMSPVTCGSRVARDCTTPSAAMPVCDSAIDRVGSPERARS